MLDNHNPEDVAKAVDHLLFDILTDPAGEYADAPAEPAFALLKPAFTVQVQVGEDTHTYTTLHLPATSKACRALAACLLTQVKGLDATTARARLEVASAALLRALELKQA